MDSSKGEVISKLSVPHYQIDVRSFLGFTSYYRRFIKKITKITSPLFKSLTKDCEFIWNFDCQKYFETLKENISEEFILRGPNWSLHFHISIDALDTALGVVLGQKYLTLVELNYTITQNEFLVVVHAINKFRHYITVMKLLFSQITLQLDI